MSFLFSKTELVDCVVCGYLLFVVCQRDNGIQSRVSKLLSLKAHQTDTHWTTVCIIFVLALWEVIVVAVTVSFVMVNSNKI